MPTRRAARERALGLAYECEQRSVRAETLLDDLSVPPDEYAGMLDGRCTTVTCGVMTEM